MVTEGGQAPRAHGDGTEVASAKAANRLRIDDDFDTSAGDAGIFPRLPTSLAHQPIDAHPIRDQSVRNCLGSLLKERPHPPPGCPHCRCNLLPSRMKPD
jgi:hypothetical protein